MKNVYTVLLVCSLIFHFQFAGLAQTPLGKPVPLLGKNLIENPGAEFESQNGKIPSWTEVPKMENPGELNEAYGHTSGEWDYGCDEKCGLPPGAGSRYFRLPVNNAIPAISLMQDIDLSSITTLMQTKVVHFTLSGYMAGMSCEQAGCAKGTLSILFFNKKGSEIARYELSKDNSMMTSISPETPAMRKFEKPVAEKEIPKGTDRIRISLQAATSACCNDAAVFFDNLSLVLY